MSQFSRQFASYIDYYYKGMFYELLEDRIVCEAIGKSLGDRNLVWSGSEPGFDYKIVDVFFEDNGNASLCFSVAIQCFLFYDIHYEDPQWGLRNIAVDGHECWYKVFLTSSLDEKMYNLHIYCIEEYSESAYLLEQDTDDIIPYIGEKDLDRIAEIFLMKHCSNALMEPMALPIEDIAYYMGLYINYVEMPADNFGQLFFAGDENDIFRGMLILNQRYIEERPEGTKNFTIAHECIWRCCRGVALSF